MLSRSVKAARWAAPLRTSYASVNSFAARRTVTTDAASSHADKNAVPAVSIYLFITAFFIFHPHRLIIGILLGYRKMISNSLLTSPQRASKATILRGLILR